MRHFVTGGSGFVGSHLVDTLVRDGGEVTVFDNLSTGKLSDVNVQATFIEGDVRDLGLLDTAMADHDVVWHLAANGDIPRGQKDANWDFQVNTVGTKNVLDAMRSNGITRILFSSTAAVYGDGAADRKPLAETYGPLLPISLYAASKLSGEAMISAYCHLFGMQAWIFRFANVVGGRMNHGITHDLIKKLKQNPDELEIWGDGKGEKPYVHVSDLIRGLLLVFQSERFKDCDIYNLGVRDYCTVDEVANIVIEETGLNPALVKRNYTGGARGFKGDVPIVRFDPTKAENLGWVPKFSSKESVRLAARRLVTEIT